jgi:hypothetical protein
MIPTSFREYLRHLRQLSIEDDSFPTEKQRRLMHDSVSQVVYITKINQKVQN